MSDAERFRDENFREERPHGVLESAVGVQMSYIFGYRFLRQDLFTDDQWRSIREILERYYGLNDLDTALRYQAERLSDGLARNPGYAPPPIPRSESDDCSDEGDEDDVDDYEQDLPFDFDASTRATNGSGYLSKRLLPGLWLTMLFAAYEHQNDREAQIRLAMYAILSDLGNPELYIPLVREESKELRQWPGNRDLIVDLFAEYGDRLFANARNRTYERFLIEERLSDAAWDYLNERRNIDQSDAVFFGGQPQWQPMFDRLAPVIAINHGDQIVQDIIKPLQDADGDLLREDTEENRNAIAAILRQCVQLGQRQVAESQIARLHRMYPKRMELRRLMGEALRSNAPASQV